MEFHVDQVINILFGMIGAVGAALVALLVWIGQRLQNKVDELPGIISLKVSAVHDQIVADMATMNKTMAELERDVRERFSDLDRRVVRLEVRDEINHGCLPVIPANGRPGQ